MATIPKLYMDAGCFIDVVKARVGVAVQSDRENDIWHTQRLLKAAFDGKIQIITSTLSIAECLYAGDREAPVSAEVKRLFDSILASGKVVSLVDAGYFVTTRARDLRWVYDVRLSGADSVHLASAKEASCVEFITIDDDFNQEYNKAGLSRLGISVIRASQTQHLPPEYRVVDLFGAGGFPL